MWIARVSPTSNPEGSDERFDPVDSHQLVGLYIVPDQRYDMYHDTLTDT